MSYNETRRITEMLKALLTVFFPGTFLFPFGGSRQESGMPASGLCGTNSSIEKRKIVTLRNARRPKPELIDSSIISFSRPQTRHILCTACVSVLILAR